MPTGDVTRPPCVLQDCDRLADYEMSAQWTLFDFVDYPVCQLHVDVVRGWLWSSTVDDAYPDDVWISSAYEGDGERMGPHAV